MSYSFTLASTTFSQNWPWVATLSASTIAAVTNALINRARKHQRGWRRSR